MVYKSKQARAAYLKGRYFKYKRALLKIKAASGGCQECGYFEHPEILQFHHVNPEDKLLLISSGNLFMRNWGKILEEIKKCKILCPNCHSWLHFQESSLLYKESMDKEKNDKN